MLDELGDATIDIQRQWLLFMLERVGHNNLSRLLDYYESVGWISEEVENRLLALAAKEEKHRNGTSWTLSAQEHRISMLFIERLMGRKIDDSMLAIHKQGKVDLKLENDLEFAIQRREVTIKNLEQELADRDVEIGKLKGLVHSLNEQLDECRKETKRNRIYRKILDENIRLRNIGFTKKVHKM